MLLTLLSSQTSTLTGTLSRTLDGATLVSSGELVTPSTLSAILIGSSNNPSYRSGFYSPRRGGTPKYPSLWDGCIGAWAPCLGQTGGRLFDQSLLQNHGTLVNMEPATDWIQLNGQTALDLDGTDEYVTINDPNHNLRVTTGDMGVSMWVYLTATTNNDVLICKGAYAQGGWQIYVGGGGSNRYLECFYDTAFLTPSWQIPLNQWVHIALSKTGSTTRLYGNGIERGSSSLGNIPSTTLPLTIFEDPFSGSRCPTGRFDDARIYNRTLSAKEIRTLATRRGIAYESASKKLALFSAPAPTGSLSSTLANATLSSSGTLATGLTGSVSVTLSDATLSATGTLTNAATGSVSSTLANATLSSSGTVAAGASGTVTRTLDAVTLSSSGTIGSGLTGSVSVSLGAATLVSSGTLTAGASGNVSRTLDNTTLSSSGTLSAGASGSVSRTLDNTTLSSTGGAAGTVTGSVSLTLAAATCSSSGTLTDGLSGSVTRTLDAVTSSATGTLTNGASGTVTRTLANATLASGGSLSAGLTAQVNRALESCVVSSSGTLASGLTGTLSVQLASATLQSGNVAVGGLRIKVGGEWKNANAFVKVTGTWKNATPFVKVSGVWK